MIVTFVCLASIGADAKKVWFGSMQRIRVVQFEFVRCYWSLQWHMTVGPIVRCTPYSVVIRTLSTQSAASTVASTRHHRILK